MTTSELRDLHAPLMSIVSVERKTTKKTNDANTSEKAYFMLTMKNARAKNSMLTFTKPVFKGSKITGGLYALCAATFPDIKPSESKLWPSDQPMVFECYPATVALSTPHTNAEGSIIESVSVVCVGCPKITIDNQVVVEYPEGETPMKVVNQIISGFGYVPVKGGSVDESGTIEDAPLPQL